MNHLNFTTELKSTVTSENRHDFAILALKMPNLIRASYFRQLWCHIGKVFRIGSYLRMRHRPSA